MKDTKKSRKALFKGDIFYLSFSTLTKLDHFPDVRKMIRDLMPRSLAGNLGLVDNLGKVLPFGISEKSLKVTGKPELFAINLVGVVLKVFMQLDDDDVAFHGMTSFVGGCHYKFAARTRIDHFVGVNKMVRIVLLMSAKRPDTDWPYKNLWTYCQLLQNKI